MIFRPLLLLVSHCQFTTTLELSAPLWFFFSSSLFSFCICLFKIMRFSPSVLMFLVILLPTLFIQCFCESSLMVWFLELWILPGIQEWTDHSCLSSHNLLFSWGSPATVWRHMRHFHYPVVQNYQLQTLNYANQDLYVELFCHRSDCKNHQISPPMAVRWNRLVYTRSIFLTISFKS